MDISVLKLYAIFQAIKWFQNKKNQVAASGGSRIFPEGSPTLRWGRRVTNLLNFPQKLHEIEKNLVARVPGVPPWICHWWHHNLVRAREWGGKRGNDGAREWGIKGKWQQPYLCFGQKYTFSSISWSYNGFACNLHERGLTFRDYQNEWQHPYVSIKTCTSPSLPCLYQSLAHLHQSLACLHQCLAHMH